MAVVKPQKTDLKSIRLQAEPQASEVSEVSEASQTQKPQAPKTRLRPKAPTTVIVHVLDGRRFEGGGLEVEVIDSFLQAQIDAGKLEVV